MKWVIEAYNKANAENSRRESIRLGAKTLWDNICRAVESTVKTYESLNLLPVAFTGRNTHSMAVIVFDPTPPSHHRVRGDQRDHIAITFDEERSEVEVRLNDEDPPKIFRMDLNGGSRVCLRDPDNREISVEHFTELVLKQAFFP